MGSLELLTAALPPAVLALLVALGLSTDDGKRRQRSKLSARVAVLTLLALAVVPAADRSEVASTTISGAGTAASISTYDHSVQLLKQTSPTADGRSTGSGATGSSSVVHVALPRARAAGVVAAEAGEDAAGIVYRRTDAAGGKPYIGQSKSDSRYIKRQSEHARANPDADFDFEIIGRARPGSQLDRMEEFYIRQGGGPTNLSNPNGGLARHQMNDQRYWGAGGDLP